MSANWAIAIAFDGERPTIAFYGRRPAGNRNLRSEFLGLHERAAGKVLPRNSQRKSQIIFDSRTGARLAARIAELTLRDGRVVYDWNGISRPDWRTLPKGYVRQGDGVWDTVTPAPRKRQ